MSIPKYIVIPEERVDANLNFMPLNEGDALWHKDDDYLNCELCNKEFTLVNRRHHCRNCGKVICYDCSQYYTSKRDRDRDRVCKLCYNCVLNRDGDGKESVECKDYMKKAHLVEKQFIADDFSIDGLPVTPGSILTITNVGRTMNLWRNDNPIIYTAMVTSLDAHEGMIKLTLTRTNDDKLEPDEKVYLQNDKASQQRNDEIPSSRIIIYRQNNKNFVDQRGEIVTGPIPYGYVYVTNVTPPAQDGGYKRRKNKSKRKNKRSLRRRRTSKRSNICRKNKKVTKRLHKSRRRRARR